MIESILLIKIVVNKNTNRFLLSMWDIIGVINIPVAIVRQEISYSNNHKM